MQQFTVQKVLLHVCKETNSKRWQFVFPVRCARLKKTFYSIETKLTFSTSSPCISPSFLFSISFFLVFKPSPLSSQSKKRHLEIAEDSIPYSLIQVTTLLFKKDLSKSKQWKWESHIVKTVWCIWCGSAFNAIAKRSVEKVSVTLWFSL